MALDEKDLEPHEEQAARPERRNGPRPKAPRKSIGNLKSGTEIMARGSGTGQQVKSQGADELDKRESLFIAAMLKWKTPEEAAALAGYPQPDVAAYDLLGRPHVKKHLSMRAVRQVFGKLLPTALQAHWEILQDPSAPASARMTAIKETYNLAGLHEEAVDTVSSANVKTIAEMSTEDLQEMIEKAERALGELGARATDVTPDGS